MYLAIFSEFLENEFGIEAAIVFAIGSDILYDYIKDDMDELSNLPVGSHIGQLNCSWLKGSLPEQFLMHYDYEFLYQMKCILHQMRLRAKACSPLIVNSVMEELLFYLCNEEVSAFIELSGEIEKYKDVDTAISEGIIFDLFGDMDIITSLYSNVHLDSDHPYHFSHWTDQQLYID